MATMARRNVEHGGGGACRRDAGADRARVWVTPLTTVRMEFWTQRARRSHERRHVCTAITGRIVAAVESQPARPGRAYITGGVDADGDIFELSVCCGPPALFAEDLRLGDGRCWWRSRPAAASACWPLPPPALLEAKLHGGASRNSARCVRCR